MKPTIAILGAGPLLGLSVARAFGSQGYAVALIARRQASLDAMVDELGEAGIEAVGFVADLTHAAQLVAAFAAIKARFGRVDVLEFSPLAMAFVPPSQVTAETARSAFEFLTVGAINAVRQVLPDMQARDEGALLFASGRSSLLPMKLLGSMGLGAAALRNYVYSLAEELKDSGIYVGTVPVFARMDRAAADAVAALYLNMIAARDRIECVYGDDAAACEIAAITQRAAPFVLPCG
ncbi:SDR family NAD(P)-dependent oxidoreductase [Sphingomonas sp. A2-49]|uniref:SDR family NAD(P)-dependent oxidoreductase n=1 Tax=Sphingomonas sp. A2-49 TaxID=1391375 RepID=UPI0021D3E97D|nr:SDR family NAD(P)-dependent oxidoreductase [Sphingomonas sp. A2-49]MCU6453099.1 SDR family NAD(P)-dependent oxidoreductase [Sphingomonas sp. A2-49]